MLLTDPSPKALRSALEKALKEANKKRPAVQCVVLDDSDQVLTHFSQASEGVRLWVRPGDEDDMQPQPFVLLAWWSDSTGTKHTRVLGGRCEHATPISKQGTTHLPAVWHVFYESCYFVDHGDKSVVLMACGCGAVGTPEDLDWRGTGCHRCAKQLEQNGAGPAPATLQCEFAWITPDNLGMIFQPSESSMAYLDFQSGKLTPMAHEEKSLFGPILFDPDSSQCLGYTETRMFRWNWTSGEFSKFTKPAGFVPRIVRPDDASVDGKWLETRSDFHPVDWSQPGNPIGKAVERTKEQRKTNPYVAGCFADDGRWIGLHPTGQIDAIDPATGTAALLKEPAPFPGIRTDVDATPRLVAINWKHDLICIAFSYSDGYFGQNLPPILVSSIRTSAPWKIAFPTKDYLPVERLIGFTPDGQWLLSGHESGSLHFHSLTKGTTRKLAFALPHHLEFVWSVEFSRDGQTMLLKTQNPFAFSLTGEARLRRLPYSTKTLDVLCHAHLSPEERFIAALDEATIKSAKPTTKATPPGNEFAPCVIIELGDDSHSLIFSQFEESQTAFEEFGFDGGGYGWHAVVDVLLKQQAPALKRKLTFDPEASALVVQSKHRQALEQVARMIQSALASPEVLRNAIQHANRKLMG